MSINLNKNIAPVSASTWKVINERAREVIGTIFSARKVFHINNIGEDKKSVNTGRMITKEKNNVRYGIYQINPLIETRINFTLNRWELDNAERGVKDLDLTALEEAVFNSVKFEESAIYEGLEGIKGILNSSTHEKIPFGKNSCEILNAISKGITLLNASFSPHKLDLIVDYDTWILINSVSDHSITKRIKAMIYGDIILSTNISTPILVPHKNENFEISISEDFAI